MFFPQEMTEVELVVPEKDIFAVTKLLGGKGIFQQTDASYLSSRAETDTKNSWSEKASLYATLEHRVQLVLQALGIDEGMPVTSDTDGLLDIQVASHSLEIIEKKVREKTELLNGTQKKIELLKSNLQQLEPIADLEINVEALHNQKYLFSSVGFIPVSNIERLESSLSKIPFVLIPLLQDNQRAVIWIAGSQRNSETIERAVSSAYFNALTLPEEYKGNSKEIIQTIHKNITGCEKDLKGYGSDLLILRDGYAKELRQWYWSIHSSRMIVDAIIRYGRTKFTYLIIGWTASSSLLDLEDKIRKISRSIQIETYSVKRTDKREDVPVSLDHPKFLSSFQMMVTTYAQPLYNEIDPTIMIAITFPIIYGAMFGDVGQGIILAVLGWLLISRKVKMLRSLSSLGGLVLACGVMATLFGFLYGSVFGFDTILQPLWIRPIDNILLILEVTIGAGIFLLTTTYIFNMINAYMARDWGRFFFEKNGLAGLLFYWSLLGLLASTLLGLKFLPPFAFVALAIICALVIMFSEVLAHLVEGHRPLVSDSLFTYLIQSAFEVFETVIGFLSNTLSYVRIGSFAVAHGGLSLAIFNIAALVSPTHGIGYVVVLIGGNLFIILFEGLIVGIQTMRLEYYEFFSKFFMGGGKTYQPLSLAPVAEK